ncbi:flavin-dependent oxidoreductase [Nonomuraea sp. NPDC059194]|uniref:flavin-dependent oxidoreductase n=1 Tax=Nonomuraea sp. NPDC059194 TaxID=3346764 RepID=UPI00369625FC
MRALIVGAGIGGLTTALSLHAAGIDCVVVDSVTQLRPLGVGINLQPHAVRELTELGLGDKLAETGVRTSYMTFTDRFGGVVVALPRGLSAGYRWPQFSIHRGELQLLLLDAVVERLGPDAVRTATAFEDVEQDDDHVEGVLRDVRSGQITRERADVLVGADGIHSAVRAKLNPVGDPLHWTGVRMWRGVCEAEPILDGSTVLVAGSSLQAKMVAYPISARASAAGRPLINWVAEAPVADRSAAGEADWTRKGRLEDVLAHFADWKYPHCDVRALIEGSARILEYPMVDRQPLARWQSGRVTLLGDAAHPMYPVGSNGGSQAVLDARVLARCLATAPDVVTGLAAYEGERREETAALTLAHRSLPMDEAMKMISERAPEGFDDIADVLTTEELAAVAGNQHRLTDQDVEALNTRPSWSVAPRA